MLLYMHQDTSRYVQFRWLWIKTWMTRGPGELLLDPFGGGESVSYQHGKGSKVGDSQTIR